MAAGGAEPLDELADAGGGERSPSQKRAGREKGQTLVGLLSRATLFPGGQLDAITRSLTERRYTTKTMPAQHVFLCSHPMSVGLARLLVFRLAVLLFGIFLLVKGGQNSAAHLQKGRYTYQHWRFTTEELRDGTTSPPHPGIADFQLVHDSTNDLAGHRIWFTTCKDGDSDAQAVFDGPSATVSFDSPQKVVSWFIVLDGDSPPERDPAVFRVEASNDLEEWTTVGSSTWRTAETHVDFLHGRTELRRGEAGEDTPVVFDARSTWAHFLVYCLGNLFSGLAMIVCVLLASFGQGYLGWTWASAGVALHGLCNLVACLAFFSIGMLLDGGCFACMGLIQGAQAVVMLRFEINIDATLLVSGALQCVCCLAFGIDLASSVFIPACANLFLGLAFTLFRLHVVRGSLRIERSQQDIYARVWDMTSAGKVDELKEVTDAFEKLKRSLKKRSGHPRQVGRVRDYVMVEKKGGGGSGAGDSAGVDKIVRNELKPTSSLESVTRTRVSDAHTDGGSPKEPQGLRCFSTTSVVVGEGQMHAFSGNGLHHLHQMLSAPMAVSRMTQKGMAHANLKFEQMPSMGLDRPMSTHADPESSSTGSGTGDVNGDSSMRGKVAHADGIVTRVMGRRTHVWSPFEGHPFTHDEQLRVKSLDQIFAQATLIDPILFAKVQSIAAQCGPGVSQPTNEQGLKSPFRCVDKVLMVYAGDVSRICDVARRTLVFLDLGGVANCLHVLQADPEIDIVRVKNRLTGVRDADIGTGYRNILINLRIHSEETASLYVDTHVCELLLIPQDFADIGNCEAFKESKNFRYCLETAFGSLQSVVMRILFLLDGSLRVSSKVSPVRTEGDEMSHSRSPLPRSPLLSQSTEESSRSLEGQLQMGAAPRFLLPFDGVHPTHRRLVESPSRRNDEPFVASPSPRQSLDRGVWAVRSPMPGLLCTTSSALPAPPDPWEQELRILRIGVPEYFSLVASLGLGTFFDEKLRTSGSLSVRSTDAGSAFYTSKPFVAAMQKPVFNIAAFLLSVLYVYLGTSIFWAPRVAFSHYRLTVLQTRSGAPPSSLGVSAFSILGVDGCAVHPELGSMRPDHYEDVSGVVLGLGDDGSVVNASVVVGFEEQVVMRGWFLLTAAEEGSQGDDPSYFEVHGTNDPARGEWALVGTPNWRVVSGFVESGYAFWSSHPSQLTEDRDVTVLYEPFAFIPVIQRSIRQYQLAIGFGAGAIFGYYGHGERAKMALSVSLFNSGVITMLAVFFALLLRMYEQAFEMSMHLPVGFLAAITLYIDRGAIRLLALTGTVDVGLSLYWMVRGKMLGKVETMPSYVGIIVLLLVLLILVLRRKALKKSELVVKDDMRMYEDLWRKISVEEADHVEHLAGVISSAGITDRSARQLNRKRVTPQQAQRQLLRQAHDQLLDGLGLITQPDTLDYTSPVKSLDQLYASGTAVYNLAVERIKIWSSGSGGMLLARTSGDEELRVEGGKYTYVFWDEVKGTEREHDIVWAPLKHYNRAVEKILRCYEGDTSKLLDICRQCLIFENITDLSATLGKILTDGQIIVVRVKNRLSAKYTASQTAGLRNVAINFRVVSDEAKALGAETHICELQLILRSYAELRNREGHKRYIQWRNCQGL